MIALDRFVRHFFQGLIIISVFHLALELISALEFNASISDAPTLNTSADLKRLSEYASRVVDCVRNTSRFSPADKSDYIQTMFSEGEMNALKTPPRENIFEVTYCPSIRWAHFHIFKCAGTALLHAFRKLCNMHGDHHMRNFPYDSTRTPGEGDLFHVMTTARHREQPFELLFPPDDPKDMKDIIVYQSSPKQDDYNNMVEFFRTMHHANYTLFTAVRDPYTKFASGVYEVFTKRKNGTQLAVDANGDREKLLLSVMQQMMNSNESNMIRYGPVHVLNAHFLPMSRFMQHLYPALDNMRYLLRLETLDHDFGLLMTHAFSRSNCTGCAEEEESLTHTVSSSDAAVNASTATSGRNCSDSSSSSGSSVKCGRFVSSSEGWRITPQLVHAVLREESAEAHRTARNAHEFGRAASHSDGGGGGSAHERKGVGFRIRRRGRAFSSPAAAGGGTGAAAGSGGGGGMGTGKHKSRHKEPKTQKPQHRFLTGVDSNNSHAMSTALEHPVNSGNQTNAVVGSGNSVVARSSHAQKVSRHHFHSGFIVSDEVRDLFDFHPTEYTEKVNTTLENIYRQDFVCIENTLSP